MDRGKEERMERQREKEGGAGRRRDGHWSRRVARGFVDDYTARMWVNSDTRPPDGNA